MVVGLSQISLISSRTSFSSSLSSILYSILCLTSLLNVPLDLIAPGTTSLPIINILFIFTSLHFLALSTFFFCSFSFQLPFFPKLRVNCFSSSLLLVQLVLVHLVQSHQFHSILHAFFPIVSTWRLSLKIAHHHKFVE